MSNQRGNCRPLNNLLIHNAKKLLAQGMSTKDVASRLVISLSSAQRISRMYREKSKPVAVAVVPDNAAEALRLHWAGQKSNARWWGGHGG